MSQPVECHPSKTRIFVIFSNNCVWFQLEFSPTMVLMILKYILKPIKTRKFKIFSNHGGCFKYIFQPMKTSKFRIFYVDYVGWFISMYLKQLRQVNSKFSPTMVDGWFSIFLCQFEQMEKFVCVLNYLFSPFRYRFLKMELYWYNFLLNKKKFCVESQDFEPNLCLDFVRKVRILSKKTVFYDEFIVSWCFHPPPFWWINEKSMDYPVWTVL